MRPRASPRGGRTATASLAPGQMAVGCLCPWCCRRSQWRSRFILTSQRLLLIVYPSETQTVNGVRVNRLCIARKHRLLFLPSMNIDDCGVVLEDFHARNSSVSCACDLASFLLVGCWRFCSSVLVRLDNSVPWSSPTFTQRFGCLSLHHTASSPGSV